MKQVTYCGLQGVFLCSSVPTLFSSAFGERVGFDMDASYVFPQSVLAAITLIGGGTGGQVGRVGGQCEGGFSVCSVAVITQSGVGSHPKLLEQKL